MYENISKETINDRIDIYANDISWPDRTMWDVAHQFYHYGFNDGRRDLKIQIREMLEERDMDESVIDKFIEANKYALDRLAEK
jgi:hypothetical protein